MSAESNNPILLSGSSHPDLAREIASLTGFELGAVELVTFPDEETYVRIETPVFHREAIVVQSLVFDPNRYFVELLLIIDALKRAAVSKVTLLIPYLGYARQDRVDRPGAPISAKLLANMLERVGADRVITMDLHSEQVEGFFDIPVIHERSRDLLIPYCRALNLGEAVVVSPDKGGIKMASQFAKQLGFPLALIDKDRFDPFTVGMHYFVGDVSGKAVIIPDDMCSTGGTLVNAANECAQLGAKKVIAVVGHGLFIGKAIDKIGASAIELVVTTNSVPLSDKVKTHPKFAVVSIAQLLSRHLSSPFS